MGIVPPTIALFRRKETPPKEDRSTYQEGKRVYGSCEKCQSVYELESGHECTLRPPQGGSVIAPSQGGDATLPVSPYTGEPYDPAWGYTTPGGQSNRALIALMKAIEREIVPSPRVDSRLIGEEQR